MKELELITSKLKQQLDTARQLIAEHVAEVTSGEKSQKVQEQLFFQLKVLFLFLFLQA